MGSPSPQTSVLLLAGLLVLFAAVWINDQPGPTVGEATSRKQPASTPPHIARNRPPESPHNGIVGKSVSAVQNQQSIPEPDRTMSFPEWVSVVSDTIVALAAVFAGVVALLGLRTWRHQLKGNAEYELARRLLRALYRTRDAVSACRSSWMSGAEMAQALRDAGVPEEEIEAKVMEGSEAEEKTFQFRWQKVVDALSDLRVEIVEYEVLKGPEIHALAKQLHDHIIDLQFAIVRHLRLRKPEYAAAYDEKARREIDRTIWEDLDTYHQKQLKDESFTARLQKAIADIEKKVKPMLNMDGRSG